MIVSGKSRIAMIWRKKNPSETYHNAKLISAAPELLKALKRISELELDDSFSERVGKITREAIAKAEWRK